MSEFQRKIDLQSVDDLQYLVANIRRAAQEKINLDLPPVTGVDPLRARVEALVAEYINEVITAAAPNIAINGLGLGRTRVRELLDTRGDEDAAEAEEFEAFDGRLFERAKELARQEEDLIEEIATLRRTVPAKVVENTKGVMRRDGEADDAVICKLAEQSEMMERGPVDLGIGALERQEMVEKTWEKSLRELGAVMRALPEMIAKKERAQDAEAYVLKRATLQ